jgi:imidazolonepropionase-like amidohydrolase
MAAMVSATSLAAKPLRLQDQIGSLAPGMQADIIGIAGNPLQDITSVKRVVFVMKGGKVYENLPRGAKGTGAAAPAASGSARRR